jgi:hypothetical protein
MVEAANEKLEAESEKLRKDLRAVERLLGEEQDARFDGRKELNHVTSIVARHENTIEHQQGEIEHLKTQFAEHKIMPSPFIPRKR